MVIEHWWSLVSTIGPATNAFCILRNDFVFFTSIMSVCVCVCVCVCACVRAYNWICFSGEVRLVQMTIEKEVSD